MSSGHIGMEELGKEELGKMMDGLGRTMSEDELKAMVTIYMLCECACSRVLSYLHTHANTPKPPLIPQRETS
jgi:alpha-D-ribose 1-methylphosphonate 5-triphosphate diphosphatase PhnM